MNYPLSFWQPPASRSRARRGFALVEIMIVVGIMAIVVAIAVPGWLRARSNARMRACQENLTKLDGAIQQLALERNLPPAAPVTLADLLTGPNGPGILKQTLACPSGFDYVLTDVSQEPVCPSGLPGHSVAEVGIVPMIADESTLWNGSGS
jgi:prepilin-type N-terminal cleavage/methylation domain-containing protein